MDLVTPDRKIREAPPELKERLPGISVCSVLMDRIPVILTLNRVFEFSREQRESVQEKTQVNRVAGGRAVRKLPDDTEYVRPILLLEIGIAGRGGAKVYEVEPASEETHAPTKHVQGPTLLDLLAHALHKPRLRVLAKLLFQAAPLLRLGRNDKLIQILRNETSPPVVVVRVALLVPTGRKLTSIIFHRGFGRVPSAGQRVDNRFFEVCLGKVDGHGENGMLRKKKSRGSIYEEAESAQGPPGVHRRRNWRSLRDTFSGGQRKRFNRSITAVRSGSSFSNCVRPRNAVH